MPSKRKKTVKSVLRIAALTLVAVFIGCNMYIWNAQSLTGNALPMPFGYGAAVVLSGSMEPELSVDDLIFVKEQDSYEVGDVVVFQSGHSVVVHRIIELDKDSVITQGDANNAPDAEMDISQIKGEVVGVWCGFGGVVRLLKSPVVSIGLIALVIFLMERSFRKEKQKGDDEMDKIKEEIRRLKAEQEQQ